MVDKCWKDIKAHTQVSWGIMPHNLCVYRIMRVKCGENWLIRSYDIGDIISQLWVSAEISVTAIGMNLGGRGRVPRWEDYFFLIIVLLYIKK